MAADDWFEIEDYYTGRKTTMEDIAAIGPEGRKAFRERPSNPYFSALFYVCLGCHLMSSLLNGIFVFVILFMREGIKSCIGERWG